MNNYIAHIADVQVRLNSRKEEFSKVFSETYKDIEKNKPRRIFLAGDLNHNKADLSPNSIDLLSEFFTNLSSIAPVDIIPGNHDLNLSQLSQGDSIRSIIQILENGRIVTNENKEDFKGCFYEKSEKSDNYQIFYYPYSGIYEIDDEIVYGHFSCIDNEIPELKEKDENKKYIALHHGTIYGSVNDNGYKNNDPSLLSINKFRDYDIVMLGDIHEHQSFDRLEEKFIDEEELEKYKKEGWEIA